MPSCSTRRGWSPRAAGALPGSRARSPLGASMEMVHEHDPALYPVILIGGSYTFETKGILTVGIRVLQPGLRRNRSGRLLCLETAGRLSRSAQGGLLSGLGMETLGETAMTDLRFLRKDYALLQYTQTNISNKIDLTFRWTQNLDDGSGQFTSVLSYSLGKHLELFSVATLMAGGKNTEFGSVLGYQVMCRLGVYFLRR